MLPSKMDELKILHTMGDRMTFKNLKTNTGMESNRQLLFCNEYMVFETSPCDTVTNSI